jgi:arylsulfatase A-like enzyme
MKSEFTSPMSRNGKPVEVNKHLTLAFGDEAAGFIMRHKAQPWFLYLAFSAPHVPHQPTPERLARFTHIKDKNRRAYDAQVSLMDDAIGEALDALRASGQEKRTLVVFLSDNGGSVPNAANNGPLRGGKMNCYEGGVRVPFVVRWPGKIPAGKDDNRLVSSLDIFATSLACAGVPMPTDKPYDSVNLIPFLSGQNSASPHLNLFWRMTEKSKRRWGTRDGDLKLVWQVREEEIYKDPHFGYSTRNLITLSDWLKHTPEELYDLSKDIGECHDLSAKEPEETSRLLGEIETWDKQAVPLAFEGHEGPDDGPHPNTTPARPQKAIGK